jgi:hypothetical protein
VRALHEATHVSAFSTAIFRSTGAEPLQTNAPFPKDGQLGGEPLACGGRFVSEDTPHATIAAINASADAVAGPVLSTCGSVLLSERVAWTPCMKRRGRLNMSNFYNPLRAPRYLPHA